MYIDFNLGHFAMKSTGESKQQPGTYGGTRGSQFQTYIETSTFPGVFFFNIKEPCPLYNTSRDQILRHARGQGNINFPCSADHEQDWQPYPVDPYSAICDDHTYIPL